jgi:2-polyprenyl-3-methyl-5-hydroxy-6-metoxy-1,4-benzoquinol methylase
MSDESDAMSVTAQSDSARATARSAQPSSGTGTGPRDDIDARLAARIEPFDSFWQAPDDVEKGYKSFLAYYSANYLRRMPEDRNARVLVISCGPGYLVHALNEHGYANVIGIDSDEGKIAHARARGLNCETARAFAWLGACTELFDVIIPEQELNHLTHGEQIEFLALCREKLRAGGRVLVYGLNGANPLVGSENLAHNIDHFNTFTEYSIGQILGLAGFERAEPFALRIYVFWRNPLNYVGLIVTGAFELLFRVMYKLYGKNVKILSKKLGAVAYKAG